jgi:exonuclease-1
MLRHHGVSPLMVFDGGPLPAKKGTEVDRAAFVTIALFQIDRN